MISKRDSLKNSNNLIRPQETTNQENQEDQRVNNLMAQKVRTTPSTQAKNRNITTIEMDLKLEVHPMNHMNLSQLARLKKITLQFMTSGKKNQNTKSQILNQIFTPSRER
jgi:hypothetical protein